MFFFYLSIAGEIFYKYNKRNASPNLPLDAFQVFSRYAVYYEGLKLLQYKIDREMNKRLNRYTRCH